MMRCAVNTGESTVYLKPMFLAKFSSTSSSIALHVSDKGVFSVSIYELDHTKQKMKVPTEVHFAIVTEPLGRIAVVGINVLQGNREVDQEEVEIIDTPEVKLHLRNLFYLLLESRGAPF